MHEKVMNMRTGKKGNIEIRGETKKKSKYKKMNKNCKLRKHQTN